MPRICKCAICGKTRKAGGNYRPNMLCRDCYLQHKAKTAKPRTKCSKCGKDRYYYQSKKEHAMCRECAKTAWGRGLRPETKAEQASRYPTESWWMRKDFYQAAKEQEARHRAQGIGKVPADQMEG